ncbi:hypothetical protein BKA66DRAFT_608140 [Pyrenochaeta sp. MPI-SDFR-AT-0127]|nr:hypothetical protein BKA66DRAFT_608140 [Pyrenochaeta sp. MPI-SDFR-AT-0127]
MTRLGVVLEEAVDEGTALELELEGAAEEELDDATEEEALGTACVEELETGEDEVDDRLLEALEALDVAAPHPRALEDVGKPLEDDDKSLEDDDKACEDDAEVLEEDDEVAASGALLEELDDCCEEDEALERELVEASEDEDEAGLHFPNPD